LDIMRMAAKNMEKRLRKAIVACTPSGETPVFDNPTVAKKKWKFWK